VIEIIGIQILVTHEPFRTSQPNPSDCFVLPANTVACLIRYQFDPFTKNMDFIKISCRPFVEPRVDTFQVRVKICLNMI
jgi:hypothetical protein